MSATGKDLSDELIVKIDSAVDDVELQLKQFKIADVETLIALAERDSLEEEYVKLFNLLKEIKLSV